MWHLQFMTYFYFETDLRSFIFADHCNIIWQQEKDKRKRCMPRKNKNWHRQGFSAVAKASRANGIWEWFRDGFLLVTEVRHFGGPIELKIHVGGESDMHSHSPSYCKWLCKTIYIFCVVLNCCGHLMSFVRRPLIKSLASSVMSSKLSGSKSHWAAVTKARDSASVLPWNGDSPLNLLNR